MDYTTLNVRGTDDAQYGIVEQINKLATSGNYGVSLVSRRDKMYLISLDFAITGLYILGEYICAVKPGQYLCAVKGNDGYHSVNEGLPLYDSDGLRELISSEVRYILTPEGKTKCFAAVALVTRYADKRLPLIELGKVSLKTGELITSFNSVASSFPFTDRSTFKDLHGNDCILLLNPTDAADEVWDDLSTRYAEVRDEIVKDFHTRKVEIDEYKARIKRLSEAQTKRSYVNRTLD